jgi:hypothetical protein
MEIQVGMKKAGLRKLGEDLIAACDRADADGATTVERVTRYIPANGQGEELTLGFDNDDMESADVAEDQSYYELSQD